MVIYKWYYRKENPRVNGFIWVKPETFWNDAYFVNYICIRYTYVYVLTIIHINYTHHYNAKRNGISHLHIASPENWLFTQACNHINSS